MQKQSVFWLMSIIALLVAACGGGGGDETAQVPYESDSFRFSYPADLAILEPHANFVLVGTSPEAISAAIVPNPTLAGGDGVLEIRVFSAEEITPQDYLTWLSASAAENPELAQFGGMEEFTEYGTGGVVVDRIASGADIKNYIYTMDDGAVVRAALYTAPGEFEEASANLLPILGTVVPNNPPQLNLDVEVIPVPTEEAAVTQEATTE